MDWGHWYSMVRRRDADGICGGTQAWPVCRIRQTPLWNGWARAPAQRSGAPAREPKLLSMDGASSRLIRKWGRPEPVVGSREGVHRRPRSSGTCPRRGDTETSPRNIARPQACQVPSPVLGSAGAFRGVIALRRSMKVVPPGAMRAPATSTCARKPKCPARFGPTRRGQFGFRCCLLRSDRPRWGGPTCLRSPSVAPGMGLAIAAAVQWCSG
jgi:hypothetical protein